MRLSSPDERRQLNWITGFAYQKDLLVRWASRNLAQVVVWLEMSSIFQGVLGLFLATIINPLRYKFYPPQPLLPTIVSKIEADTLHDLQQYILTHITPVSQEISLKLRYVEDLSNASYDVKKQAYEEAIALYHQMSPYIETANSWLTSHKEFETDRTFIELKAGLVEAARLVNKIAKLNADGLFLMRRVDGPPPLNRPIGLVNENTNDCFINAIRQLMLNIPVLRKLVLEKLPPEKYSKILANAALYFLAQRRGETAPLGGSSSSREEVDMQTGRQEDAFEALGQLFNDIVDIEKVYPHLPLSPGNVKAHNPLLFWTTGQKRVEVGDQYESFSEQDQMKVSEAGWLPAEQTPNSSVILDLKGVDNISLEMALKKWARFEGRGDTYRVSKKDGGNLELPIIEETNQFEDLPPYLVLTLKRFERELGMSKKESRTVDMDEHFVLPGSLVRSNKNGRYRIKGFVSHQGSTVSNGHYVAYVFIPDTIKSQEGKWYCCDDKVVTEVDIATVKEALSYCYFVYSELEGEITHEATKAFLRMRELQTLALETRLAEEASIELAKQNTPQKRLEAAKTELELIQLFSMSTSEAEADPVFLTSLFNQLPSDAYRFFLKVLELEKGYSQTKGAEHLNELRTIVSPYLVREQADETIRNIISQYIYMQEQYILGLRNSENLKKASEFHLKQLLALQSILEQETVKTEHVELILPYLCDEFQSQLSPLLRDKFDQAALQKQAGELIEATLKILQD